MLTLGIETATETCSIALLDGPSSLVETALHVPRSHGRRLSLLIKEALAHADRAASALGLVAVSAGPGSYTGLRIGLATAKGLVLATGAEFIAVPTLEALAEAVGHRGGPLVTVLPSRRGEVYVAAYASGQTLRPPTALPLSEAADWLPRGDIALVGPGAERLAEATPGRDFRLLDGTLSGLAVARLGTRRYAERGADDPASVEPAYLKPVVTSQPRAILGA